MLASAALGNFYTTQPPFLQFILHLLLVFFGLFAHGNAKQGPNLNVLTILFMAALTIVIFRHNGFTVIPPIALSIALLLIKKGPYRSTKTIAAIFCISLALALCSVAINRAIVQKESSISSEFLFRIVKKDLRGMSIRSGHQGITKNLPENLKK